MTHTKRQSPTAPTGATRRPTIIGTLMVRDEVDIIAAMIEHHIAQGLDRLIVTDNGSVDGTTEVLQQYADAGFVELHHDPVHRKQQHALVTNMARRARTEYGADWVINADADEFWVPRDKSLTLREALEATPLALNAFPVPVTNLVGPPARSGAGFDRLCWRDARSKEQLNAIGIFAHPTANAIHRGDPTIVVAQGNHFVNLKSTGTPDPAFALEVIHLPWRSWAQHERRVLNTGRAYDANPDLNPSPNHHMMNDYRRYQAGRMWYLYLLRLPSEADLIAGEADGRFVRDPWLSEYLHSLVDRARRPDLLAACLDRPTTISLTRANTPRQQRSVPCSPRSNASVTRRCERRGRRIAMPSVSPPSVTRHDRQAGGVGRPRPGLSMTGCGCSAAPLVRSGDESRSSEGALPADESAQASPDVALAPTPRVASSASNGT